MKNTGKITKEDAVILGELFRFLLKRNGWFYNFLFYMRRKPKQVKVLRNEMH